MQNRSFALTIAFTLLLPWLGGCCCCFSGSGWQPSFTSDDGAVIDGTDDGGDTSSPDPNLSKELQDAHEYAQKALSAKGYGAVTTADLRKDGLTWYVSGTAAGLDGGDVSYVVTFQVTRYDTDNEARQTWAVQTVSVDGEVVYP